MDMFKKWISAMDITDLIEMVKSVSGAITALRDKPFCTVRELEELQNDLYINRILLKLLFEELQYNRELSTEEQGMFAELIGGNV